MGRSWIAALALVLGCAGPPKPPPQPPRHQLLQEADLAFENQEVTRGADLIRRAFDRPGIGLQQRDYARHAAALLADEGPEECLRFIDDIALANHPDSPLIFQQEVFCLRKAGRESDAIELANRIAAAVPDMFLIQLYRGHHYSNRYYRDPSKCADAFAHYLEHRPDDLTDADALPRLRLGLCYLKVGKGAQAETEFTAVAKQFSRNTRWILNANNGLCAAYTKNKKFERAVELCERILEDPRNIDRTGAVWFNLASASYQLRAYGRALEAVNEFIQWQPHKKKGRRLREKILGKREGSDNTNDAPPPDLPPHGRGNE